MEEREPYWDIMFTQEQRKELIDLLASEHPFTAWAEEIVEKLSSDPHGYYLD